MQGRALLLRRIVAGALLLLLVVGLVWVYQQYNLYALQLDWTRQGYDDRAFLMQEQAKKKGWFFYPVLLPVKYTPKTAVP